MGGRAVYQRDQRAKKAGRIPVEAFAPKISFDEGLDEIDHFIREDSMGYYALTDELAAVIRNVLERLQ